MNKKYKRVTRADIAKHAGVSETIVSYVVNNNRYVDKSKRDRVEKAIKELNYYPNSSARALKGKLSNHIVFIADQITNEHFSKLVAEMDKYAYDKDFMISLCANRNNDDFVSRIISRQYDGVIISSISFHERYIAQLMNAGLPVVILKNRDYDSETIKGAAIIETGLYDGARSCVSYLKEIGRKHILYLDRISTQGHFSTWEDLRFRGFWDQMKDSGLPVDNTNIITNCSSEEELSEKLRRHIEAGIPVDAVFGRNDRIACIGMQTLLRMGIKIPQEVAVVGYDNSSLSRYTTPTLTTVEMQREEVGKAAIEMLYQMINKNITPTPKSFGTRIIVRQSTNL